MIEESKCCNDLRKKDFNKELVMTKEDNEDFKNSTKCWVCDYDYINNNVKARNHCHITEKYRESARRDYNIIKYHNLKLNHKILIIFHNLRNYDSHLVIQELGNSNLKISVIPNGLEKYISFTINNNLRFSDSFQFLSSSLDYIVKNINKDAFEYLSQEYEKKVY